MRRITHIRKEARLGGGIGLLSLALLLAGCAQTPARPVIKAAAPARATPPKRSKPTQQASDQKQIGVVEHGAQFLLPDPKRPGRLLWKLNADSFSGRQQSSGFAGDLTQLSAVLYQNGKPAATLAAPSAHGDSATKIIKATGGIFLKSLTQPGTTLRADTVTWYAAGNKIVASGNVVYHTGKGVVIRCPSLVADTVLKTIRSAGAGSASIPKRL